MKVKDKSESCKAVETAADSSRINTKECSIQLLSKIWRLIQEENILADDHAEPKSIDNPILLLINSWQKEQMISNLANL